MKVLHRVSLILFDKRKFHSIIDSYSSMAVAKKGGDDFKVPEIFDRRTLPEDIMGQRYLDDEEVVISSLVDQAGHISRLFDFMVVLTRIEKVQFCMK